MSKAFTGFLLFFIIFIYYKGENMTHIVDMDNVSNVFNICKYYDDIINYEIEYDDMISFYLIDFYKDYVFSYKDDDKIKLIDSSMYKYVSDYKYRKGLMEIINIKDIDINSYKKTNKLIRKIIRYDDNYENERVRNIVVSRWI